MCRGGVIIPPGVEKLTITPRQSHPLPFIMLFTATGQIYAWASVLARLGFRAISCSPCPTKIALGYRVGSGRSLFLEFFDNTTQGALRKE